MKRCFVIWILMAAVLVAFSPFADAANFYWKPTKAALDAITGLTSGDRGVVITEAGKTTFYYHNGSVWVAAGSSAGSSTVPETKCTTFLSVSSSSDYPALIRFAYAVTLKAWHGIQAGATSIVGAPDNCDGNASNCNAVSIDATVTAVDGGNSTLNAYKAIPSGNYMGWHTTSVTGTNTWMTLCVDYTID